MLSTFYQLFLFLYPEKSEKCIDCIIFFFALLIITFLVETEISNSLISYVIFLSSKVYKFDVIVIFWRFIFYFSWEICMREFTQNYIKTTTYKLGFAKSFLVIWYNSEVIILLRAMNLKFSLVIVDSVVWKVIIIHYNF